MAQINHVAQFPDLTEILFTNESWRTICVNEDTLKDIKTEFIFHVHAVSEAPSLVEVGFKPVSCMNNWFSAHRKEWRRMTLYWKRNPLFEGEKQEATRVCWGVNDRQLRNADITPYAYRVPDYARLPGYQGDSEYLAGSGCGFNLGELPFVEHSFHRFFTLMRMPVRVKLGDKKWLVERGYRLLDRGKFASYWINGWDPKEYSVEKERNYFGVNKSWESIKAKVENGNR